MVGEMPAKALLKNTRRMPIQCCLGELQRWTTAYLPLNERAAIARSRKRCSPVWDTRSRGRTLSETALLLVSPVVAL